MQALDAFQVALKYNTQSSEVSKKIKRLTQLAKDKKRAIEVETMRSNVDMSKHMESLKTELVSHYFAFSMFVLFTCSNLLLVGLSSTNPLVLDISDES